ncbi:hypothetical protein IFR05_010885 [Cadophora sp. M221]|nr:hypothetical protein IFR05_010885 [Cadophora sp. M221]
MFEILVGILFDNLNLQSLVFGGIFLWIVTWLPYITLCVCTPIAFSMWLFSVDTGLLYLLELLWTKRGDTSQRAWRGIFTFFIHLFLWRCVHAGNCKCFRGRIPLKEHKNLPADVEPNLRTQLATALADLALEKQNNTSLNISSGRWREQALAAEKLNTLCRKEHRDVEDFLKANIEFRKRISDLQKENSDLRNDFNLERRSKGRHPLFQDHPGNLAERNRDLEQQVHILLGDAKNAHEALDKLQPFSTKARAESVEEIKMLQHVVKSYKEEIRELNEKNLELENLGRLNCDDAKRALRNRVLDLQHQLLVAAAKRSDAIRDKVKAEKLLATSREEGSDRPPGNADCTRCAFLQKRRSEAEARVREVTAELKSQSAGIRGVEMLVAVIALFEETDLEVGLLSGLRKFGKPTTNSIRRNFLLPLTVPSILSKTPIDPNQLKTSARGSSSDDAIRELTYIYDYLKAVMVKIKKADPGQSVNLSNLTKLLNLVPGLFKFQQEIKARFAAHQAEIRDLFQDQQTKKESHEVESAKMLQQVNEYKQTTQGYHDAARQARAKMDPGTATDPDYTVEDFIPQAVAAIEMLNNRIEQQIVFNRSTPNEHHAQLDGLQDENLRLGVKMNAAGPMYHKVMMEADRLRLEIETQAINS